MLKKRIVATLVIKEGIVVQSFGFKNYLPVGKPDIAIEYLNKWGIDEIIYLDISATKNKIGPDYTTIKNASKKCQVPLTVGGGITNLEQMKELMHCGADKISINQSASSITLSICWSTKSSSRPSLKGRFSVSPFTKSHSL